MNKDDSYWLKVAYVVFAAVVFYTLSKAIGTLGLQTGWAERYDTWYPLASIVLSSVLSLFATYYLVRNKGRHEYFLSSVAELRRVTWPSMPDTRRMTLIVCVVVGIFAVIMTAFDFLWAKVLSLLLA